MFESMRMIHDKPTKAYKMMKNIFHGIGFAPGVVMRSAFFTLCKHPRDERDDVLTSSDKWADGVSALSFSTLLASIVTS